VGACVGARGARVKSIVRELGGEKIDIIRYYPEPKDMILEALKPAIPRNILMDEASHRISIEVSEDDLAVAIGRKGQNARLTSRLIGWKVDIGKVQSGEIGLEGKVKIAIQGLNQIPGIDDETAQRLVNMGLISPDAFLGVEAEDLVEGEFTLEEANAILDKVNAFNQSQKITS